MAVTPVGSFVVNNASGSAASVNVPTGAGTDLEVAWGGSDFYTLGTFGPPSGGGWTLRQTVDLGANTSKIRCWTRTAPAGAHTVTLAPISDEEVWLGIRRLAGADLTNPVIDVDGATAANENHQAPALTLGAEEGYLIGAAMTAVFEGGGTYTTPAGFTELADFNLVANAATATVAEDSSATGTVGPFTFVYSGTGDAGVAGMIAIRAASIITGTLSETEDNDTLAASGTHTPPPITGSLAETEDNDTLAGSGTHTPPSFTGTVNVTEQNDTLAAAGTVTPPAITGTVNFTEANDTLVASGTHTAPPVSGSLAETEDDDTLAGSGTFTPPSVTGTVNVTEQNDTLASSGTFTPPPITGTLGVTEQDDTLVGSGFVGTPSFTGTVNVIEADDTLAGSGIVTPPSFTGTVNVTEQDDTLVGSGTFIPPPITGTLAITEQDDTLAAAGFVTGQQLAPGQVFVVRAGSRTLRVPRGTNFMVPGRSRTVIRGSSDG